ncbi:GCD1 Nucleoside-diphosphate-sugar pyrophosphorylase involved in lipopolysaccharide biosynthesis/translation initiation factor 2B, gamma/epsilon subunits (eIF-2Bgamma/eIF-2Bepsilon) [Candidatus Nanopelagicaceae bacterium]
MAVAILLVGGFGTRLMPLTKNTPKPMLTVAGIPVTEHQIAMAKAAGISEIVLATSYLSEIFTPYFGDGSKWGIKIKYAIEKEPLGTGGAIRNAAQLLSSNESIVILNGDVLSSHDLAGQIRQHEAHDADVTLHLTQVEDARAFGCVPTDDQGRVTAFLEKMDNPITNQINAGCYVFNPRVLSTIPLDTVVSVERETFPQLVANNAVVYGYVENAYWLDIGTPRALLKASIDIVHKSGESLVMSSAQIDPTATISGGSCVGLNSVVGPDVTIEGSIIEANVVIEKGAIITNSFVAAGAHVDKGAVIGSSFVTIGEILPIPQ